MPLVQTRGAASAQGFGEFAQVTAVNYIEDMFSCFLYTGNNSTLSINNNIDLLTKGGLVWIKNRQQGSYYHTLVDTLRGANKQLYSNTTDAQSTATGYDVTAFTSTGFTLGPDAFCNQNNGQNVSWTFRKQPKFFDVVTYTGNGTASRAIPHNLGSVPACIIIKSADVVRNWTVYHRSLNGGVNPESYWLKLNLTDAVAAAGSLWGSTAPTSTDFYVGSGNNSSSGETYVAYLFAHDAGGFGLSGTDNVISCGSFTTNGSSTTTVNLGYEPQWVMVKVSSGATGNWYMLDTMRGLTVNVTANTLSANIANAEQTNSGYAVVPTATGFTVPTSSNFNNAGYTYIYIAIRRGPMKVPTLGTSVFAPSTYTGSNSVNQVINTGFTVDMTWARARNAANSMEDYDRLRGNTVRLSTDLLDDEISSTALYFDLSNSVSLRAGYNLNYSTLNFIAYNFRRAPSFFDEVCYTGTGVARTVTHNLGAVPELMIVKARSAVDDWMVYAAPTGNTDTTYLNSDREFFAYPVWNNTTPSSTVFSIKGSGFSVNNNGTTYVAYLFASCPGVSKVGSYTGTGALQTINCGFTGGARFVLIMRTDTVGGDRWVYDSARGITSGNDPYLYLNTTAAEVTGTNYVDTDSTGFKVTAAAPAGLNANGGTYIFLAIA